MFPEDVSQYTSFDLDESIPLLLIFHKNIFHHEIDYEPLQLALRLASAVLQTDDAIRLLYVLFTSKRRSFIDSAGKACIETVQDPTALSRVGPLKRNLVLDKLEELALITEWHHNRDPEEGDAQTITNRNKTSSDFPGGYGSCIVLPRPALKTYRDDPAATLVAAYELAQIVVHELGHAIGVAVDGKIDPEVFFPGQEFSELGFSLQQVAFGGLMELRKFSRTKVPYTYDGQKDAQIEQVMTLEQWPNENYVRDYLRDKFMIGIRDENAMTDDVKEKDPIVLPFKNVWRVFQKSFWFVTVPREGKKAFELEWEVKRVRRPCQCAHCKHKGS